jgi:tetratricopeptide (TPR) repeat protein
MLLVLFAGPLAETADAARPARMSRADLDADYRLAAAHQQRDRGQLDEALAAVLQILEERPDDFEAHRFYMELAATSRRNGGLVEAEYGYMLAQSEGGSSASLLYATAMLTSELTSAAPLRASRAREIERRLSAAEADTRIAHLSYLVGVDLGKLKRSLAMVKERLALAVALAPANPSVRVEQIQLYALENNLDAAAQACLALIDASPWRAEGCTAVMRGSGGAELPSDSLQEQIQKRLRAIEKRYATDSVVLQALASLYREVGDRKAARTLRARLAELAEDWRPVLRRNPYLPPLPGGELSEEELAALEQLRNLSERSDDDPWELVKALTALDSTMQASPRIRAMYLRQKAYALRDPEVLDRDGSRSAVREAMQALPRDPHIMNEWAYMSALDKVDLVAALETIDEALELLLGEDFRLLALDPGESFDEWEGSRSESVGAFVDTRGWLLYQLGRHAEAERTLELATLLSSDGTVQGHLGRARYAVGNDDGAFHNLLRALALGTEDTEQVRDLASHLYEERHVVPGGLDLLVEETRRQLGVEAAIEDELFELPPSGSREGARGQPSPPRRRGSR